MKRLALILAVLAAPLCAENYVTCGAGPYVLLPNVGLGYTQELELGKVDLQANVSFCKMSTISEVKGAWRLPLEDYYVAPSVHVGYESSKYSCSSSFFGIGVNLGKELDGGFCQMSIQDNIFSHGFSEIPNIKLQYGVYF